MKVLIVSLAIFGSTAMPVEALEPAKTAASMYLEGYRSSDPDIKRIATTAIVNTYNGISAASIHAEFELGVGLYCIPGKEPTTDQIVALVETQILKTPVSKDISFSVVLMSALSTTFPCPIEAPAAEPPSPPR